MSESLTALPTLEWTPTKAREPRAGVPVDLIVVHRWGVAYTGEEEEKIEYGGVVRFFSDPANKASAHVVFPGSAVPGQATQMVGWSQAAWAEAAFNRKSDDVECADAIWLPDKAHPGKVIDEAGLMTLAAIVSHRLIRRSLPAYWSVRSGFCRHADLGAAGGGHSECPTTNVALWRRFVAIVQADYRVRQHVPQALWGRL
jgi:hypothetical protein